MAFVIAGWESDDDDTCRIVDTRILDTTSVFRVFQDVGDDCFLFEGGFFGPVVARSASPTRLFFSEGQPEAQPPMARFLSDPEDPNEPNGEGNTDGVASCNYTYLMFKGLRVTQTEF